MKDMTKGSPSKILIAFVLPMLVGNIFQQLYSMVDSIVVGNFVGADALAAVGSTGNITYLSVTLAIGLSVGGSILIGQLFGAGRKQDLMQAINTCLGFTFIVSIVVMAICLLGTRPLLRLLNAPPETIDDSALYLYIYFAGLIFIFMYNMLSAIFRALGDSRSPFIYVTIASILNVALDLWFVISFGWGVAGVAIATLIAQVFTGIASYIHLSVKLRAMFPEQKMSLFNGFSRETLRQVLRLALPSTLQEFTVALSLTLLQGFINPFGPAVMAAYAACSRVESLGMMPMINISAAMSAYSAQNMGAGRIDRVKEGLRSALIFSVAFVAVLGLAAMLFSERIVGLFVSGEGSAEVIEMGAGYLKIMAISFAVMGVCFPFEGVLKGSGDVKFFMVNAMLGAATRLLFAWIMIPSMGYTAIWWCGVTSWCVEGSITVLRYLSGRWKNKTVVQKDAAADAVLTE